jgi:hypothetical protein
MIDWTEMRVEYDAQGNPISGEVVFSHVDDKTGEVRHFAVERLNKHIERMAVPPKRLEVKIDYQFAAFAITRRGIEPHRFERITPADIAQYPILLAHMPGVGRDTPDNHLIIDGSHRYVKAATLGWKTIPAYELPEELWKEFLIRIPEELVAVDRDRLSNQHINPIDSRIP